MRQHDGTEPFFITEDIEAEMVEAGYVFEPPIHVSTARLTEVLACFTDGELPLGRASWPKKSGRGDPRQERVSRRCVREVGTMIEYGIFHGSRRFSVKISLILKEFYLISIIEWE
ncbi:hypothetical protein XACN24_07520 [Xanthomonas albilineans]|nr:hypothetical protein XaFJ1_GM001541 [Xanthomonas albilineans]